MPTRVVNVHEAKTHLSRLLRDVEAGQEIEIARDGKPIARIVRIIPKVRPLGGDEGTGFIPDDFDEMEEDLLEAFYADDLR